MTMTQPNAAGVTPAPSRNARARMKPHSARQFAPLAILVVMIAVIAAVEPAFLAGGGIRILAVQCLPVLFLALGQMTVMLTGGLDLSNAALAVFSGIVLAKMLGPLGALAPILALLIVMAAGALNGLISSRFQVPTFAITLGALGIWQAASLIVSNETTVYVTNHLDVVEWLLDYRLMGLEVAVWIGVAICVIIWMTLRWTVFGQNIRAVGLNELSATLSGVPRARVRVAAFALSGLLAGCAGIILTAQQGTATASGAGIGLLLPAIAAAVTGGCAITGGVAQPLNVLVGALIITLIPIGSSVLGIDPRSQQVVYGVIIIIAVVASLDRRRRTANK